MARWGFSLLALLVLIGPAAGAEVDVAKLARALGPHASHYPAGVMISFTMPQASLQRLVTDTARAHLKLYLNGLVANSIRATARRIRALDPRGRGQWEIEPRLFTQLGIKAVPVLVLGHENGFSTLAGDVPLAYGLEKISRGQGQASGHARDLLELLRVQP